MTPTPPSHGEVWLVDLDPVRGHETGKTRPALVISIDPFNHSRAGLVWVIPITSKEKRIPSHVRIRPPAGGVKVDSFIKCEELRCVSRDRLMKLKGTVDSKTISEVQYAIKFFLGF